MGYSECVGKGFCNKYVLTPKHLMLDNLKFNNFFKVNYLIDEGVDTGKGSNTVVSLLHHYLAKYGLGAQHLTAHADNCVGQNKNNTVIQVKQS